MKKGAPAAPVKPAADHDRNRPLDLLGATPDELDAGQPSNHGDMRLPHERDESPKEGRDAKTSSSPLPRQVVEQAASDITRGLRDSERRGTPSNVPAPGPEPEDTQGGEVPEAGIDRRSTASRQEQMKKPPDQGKGGRS